LIAVQTIPGRFNSYHTKFNCWPLDDIYRERITINMAKLVDEIDCSRSRLLNKLFAKRCINAQQMQSITDGATTSADKTGKLLMILLRRSVKHYIKFVECLEKESGVSHVVEMFHLDLSEW
jgi:Caspase recruitment domain